MPFCTLIYRPSPHAPEELLMKHLYEAGFDDALVLLGVADQISVQFDVQELATFSLLQRHQTLIKGGSNFTLVNVKPVFLTLLEASKILGIPLGRIKKLYASNPLVFPAPSLTLQKQSLWIGKDLLNSLQQLGITVPDPLLEAYLQGAQVYTQLLT